MPSDGAGPDSTEAVGYLRRSLAALSQFDPAGSRRLALLGLGSFLAGISEAVVFGLISVAAVGATGSGDGARVMGAEFSPGSAVIVAGFLLALSFGLGLVVAAGSSRMVAEASLAARSQLLEAYFGSSFEQKAGGRIATIQDRLTTYVDRIQGAFTNLSMLVSAALSVLSYAVIAAVVDPITLIGLAFLGLLVVVMQRPFVRRTKAAAKELRSLRSGYAANVTESVLLGRELSVFGVQSAAMHRLSEVDHVVSGVHRRARFLQSINSRVYQTIALACVLVGLAWVVNGSGTGLVGLAAVALILLRSLSYGQVMLGSMQQLAEHSPFVDELVDLIDHYEGVARTKGGSRVSEVGELVLQGVSFSYAERSALRDVSLRVDGRETLGVVGPSGAGKTTLANVMLRLYAAREGAVYVDGVDIQEIEEECWHRLTAIVPQEPRLIMGTIADNIRFFRDIPDDRVEAAAVAANIDRYIRSLPEGYNSPVGELGANLSGGQRQRLCIARALAGDPQILVLDEPTSALDGESESAIQATLTSLRGKVAMIIVAHRLSTLSICDRIAIVDEGRLVDIGTHEELRERSAYFREALMQAGL